MATPFGNKVVEVNGFSRLIKSKATGWLQLTIYQQSSQSYMSYIIITFKPGRTDFIEYQIDAEGNERMVREGQLT